MILRFEVRTALNEKLYRFNFLLSLTSDVENHISIPVTKVWVRARVQKMAYARILPGDYSRPFGLSPTVATGTGTVYR